MKINQFHSGSAVGDAITNEMLLIQKILQKNGYESDVYAEFICDELKGKIKDIKDYKDSESNILIIHHSMGINVFDKIVSFKDKKCVIYHNITPEIFFTDSTTIKYVRLGLQQMKDYGKYADYFIADSNFNRKDMISMGLPNAIDVLPVQISLNRFDGITATSSILNKYRNSKNILFVGRVAWDKCQADAVKAFAAYHNIFNKHSNLFLVGDTGMSSYVKEIENLAIELGIHDCVFLTGKVTEEDLKAYYEISSVFLCMSEHEGFGVPLLEAMKLNKPVIAYSSSAIPETMGKSGCLVTEKNFDFIGSLINEIITDENLYSRIVEHQRRRIAKLENADTEKLLLKAINNIINKKRKRTVQLQGSFETSYSLARVNRKLIETIYCAGNDDVSIFCTEGPGDYLPDEKNLKDKPLAKKLWLNSKDCEYPDVVIRNMYPPRVYDVNGGLNFQYFYWEESVIPDSYIKNFNKYLDGIGTASEYVTEKLIECGLTIPVKTVGNGVDLVENFKTLKPFKLKTKKKIKFLHISSAFPRKGIDVLLKGYYEAFNGNDDVCLVLKTFPNIHNNVESIVKELDEKYKNPPEIEWYNYDMTDEELNSLYKAADCYVQVARGEGFGLPVAEAMLAKIPVIVCANSGMADFCNADTALLVDYKLSPAHSHVQIDGSEDSIWAEPNLKSLIKQFRDFVSNKDSDSIKLKIEKAYTLITEKFSWKKVAERWLDFIDETSKKQLKPKVGMVCTWNSKCGVAEYSKLEIESSSYNIDYKVYPNFGVALTADDENYVQKRLWAETFEEDYASLVKELINSDRQIIHIQFHYGLFPNIHNFKNFLRELLKCKKLIITFHKTADEKSGKKTISLKTIVPEINKCSAIIVHQQEDRSRLIGYGVKESVLKLIPLGQIVCAETPPELSQSLLNIKSRHVVGSYGFLLEHKGIKETVQAVSILKKKYADVLYLAVCALYTTSESKKLLEECGIEIERLGLNENVKMITDFLPNDKSMKYLQACNVLALPYKHTEESASGAVRFCVAALRPLVTTKEKIFDEFKDCTVQIDEAKPEMIADGIEHAMNSELSKRLVENEKKYIKETSWNVSADKFYKLYTEILAGKQSDV